MLPQPSTAELKAACALLSAGEMRGTAFLVSAERLLTCNHVIKSAVDGPIRVSFPHGQYAATVELVDVPNDCALLLLTRPVPASDAQPLVIASEPAPRGTAWEGFGFPAATGQAGLLIDGLVQDPDGQDQAQRPAVVLKSANVTAGSCLAGYSGSPAVAQGRVIGQLRNIIPDASGGAQLAIVFACPAGILADLMRRRSGPGALVVPSHGSAQALYHVPVSLSPYFTGRMSEEAALRQRLHEHRIVALTGLGGMGKTQTAVAYAQHHRDAYPVVLWLPGDTPASFEQGLFDLGLLLFRSGRLAAFEERNPAAARRAVLDYLRQASDYLLICDNLDDPFALQATWPGRAGLGGHVLITSRSQDSRRLGAVVIELGKLPPGEASSYFSRQHPAKGTQEQQALCELVEELDGLPLALAQAAAFLVEHQSRYTDYLRQYRKQRLGLLEKGLPEEYPKSVATTWALSLQQVEQTSAASLDLLKLCTLLHSDAIAEELFARPVPALGERLCAALQRPEDGDALVLDYLLKPLRSHALLQRDREDRLLSLHRLVQQVLLYRMPKEEQQHWAQAAVSQLNEALPEPEFPNWAQYRRLISQVPTLLEHIERLDLSNLEAASLLSKAGYFLGGEGRYAEADQLHRHALAIREEVLGAEHVDVARTLNHMAWLPYRQGKFADAEPLCRRALAIQEKLLGSEHLDVAASLSNLGWLLQKQGKPREAKPFCRRALAIRKKLLGEQHPDVATSLDSLAAVLGDQGKLPEAETTSRRALAIREQVLGQEHPDLGWSLDTLGALLHRQGKLDEAESLSRRALAILEKTMGSEHPDILWSLKTLEAVLSAQGRCNEAAVLRRRILAMGDS